ncbi:CPBP family intramembrane metalloprotease [Acetobacteraceae bacterium KSS8]|uniref:CPBP family intramembrane metalloprotease n=1 Tax=Endosaccharibacter trunci TaxID=2812733 RepID=A0ABT1W425_9PROT|nr:CPBP family intramembrane metalloprotease [Acetobacteraceae bacterium KSS8]
MKDRHLRWRPSLRDWTALLFLALVYLQFDRVADAVDTPLAKALNLPVSSYGQLKLWPYALLMVIRLVLELAVVAAVCGILRRRISGWPLVGPESGRLAGLGLGIGLVVMSCVVLAITATGSATVSVSMQSPLSALGYGTSWFLFDFIGATGEELFGRVAVLLVAERFVGWRGAIVVSGCMFFVLHLDNPGVSWIWLARLFCQGTLLAYAVYRTGSVWWSVGYHTGWNWVSAPLFGAAGSGYLDEGHLLDFKPTGSSLLTGGAVGPEGSVFAFIAVLCAFGLLVAATSDRRLTGTSGRVTAP